MKVFLKNVLLQFILIIPFSLLLTGCVQSLQETTTDESISVSRSIINESVFDLPKGTISTNQTYANYELLASSAKPVRITTESTSYNGVYYSKALDLQGGAEGFLPQYRAIKFYLSKGQTVKVITNANADRYLQISDGNAILKSQIIGNATTEFCYTADTDSVYYIYSKACAIRLFSIVIENSSAEQIRVYSRPSYVSGPQDIIDFDKYYKPAAFNYDMFDASSKYSWHRFKQSNHFFVFWEAGFGDDPNSSDLDPAMRVDVDDLLMKAEEFYKKNIEEIKMCTVGQNKSYLDKYKMEIYLVYQTQWLAQGSGYDNVIGALWVNPSTCKPVGKVIAHEIGHCFQYQVYCDKLYNGETNDYKTGWRYGFGPDGKGGNGYWEQCANWQAFQSYPEQAYSITVPLFTKNAHRHFNNEFMRYQSVWFQYYFTQKHGIEAFSRLWKESRYPEDPIDTYIRLYCNGNINEFWKDYYEYATHVLTYDFGDIHDYYESRYTAFNTVMYQQDGRFRPGYENCISTAGFNAIQLNVPAINTTVNVNLYALLAGSALADDDPGYQHNADGKVTGQTKNYNDNLYNGSIYMCNGYRFGFVGIKNGKATYGTMAAGYNGSASMKIDENYDSFYLVVVGAPSVYVHQYWNDNEADDLQWPYEVEFTNTNVKGYPTVYTGNPENIQINLSYNCDINNTSYVLDKVNLKNNGILNQIAQAFKIDPSEMKQLIEQPKVGNTAVPSEGKIVIGLLETDGNINYSYSATSGFWCNKEGNRTSWSADCRVFFEYNVSDNTLTYGHYQKFNKANSSYVMKPVFVYVKDGKTYTAILNINLVF